MARNKLPGFDQAPTVESGLAREVGGGSGVPIPSEEIVTPRAIAGAPSRPVKRFRVVNGGAVMYGNCRTGIRAGKIVTEREFDIELLRRQGIRLEELPDEGAAAQATG